MKPLPVKDNDKKEVLVFKYTAQKPFSGDKNDNKNGFEMNLLITKWPLVSIRMLEHQLSPLLSYSEALKWMVT